MYPLSWIVDIPCSLHPLSSINSPTHTTGLEALFRRYDTNGEGTLDAAEFSLACEDLGFGALSFDLFRELDPDESGCAFIICACVCARVCARLVCVSSCVCA